MKKFFIDKLGSLGPAQGTFIVGESFGVAIIQVTGIALALVLNICWVRFLGTEGFGHYSFALSWVSILAVAGSMGWGAANVRLIPKYLVGNRLNDLSGLVLGSLGLTALLTLAVGTIFSLVLPNFYQDVPSGFYLATGVLVIPMSYLLVVSGILKGFKRIAASQFVNLVVRPVLMIVLIGAARYLFAFDRSPVTGIIINFIASLCALGSLVFLLRPYLKNQIVGQPRRYPFREWFHYTLPLTAIVGINVINARIGILVIGMELTPEATGQYAACVQISLLAGFGLVVVGMVAQPVLSELYTKRDFEQIRSTLRLTARGALSLSIPIAIGILIGGKWVLKLMSESFVEAYPVLVILTLGQMISVFFGQVGSLLVMTDMQLTTLYILSGSVLLHVVLLIVFVPFLGIFGAGLSVGMVTLFWNIMMTCVIYKKFGLRATAI